MRYTPIILLLLVSGCHDGSTPGGPYENLDSDALVSELPSPDSAALCDSGWEWVVAERGRDYSHAFCANHLSPFTWTSLQGCEGEMEACIAQFPLTEVASDVCSRALDEARQCRASIRELQTCFRDISIGYAESTSTYGCAWLMDRDKAGSPVPTPESCNRLPTACRRLLGFGG